MAETFDVAIVGAGVVGCALADELAVRGGSVVVLERERVASGASYGAAGIIGTQTDAEGGSPMLDLALSSRTILRELDDRLNGAFDLDLSGAVRITDDPERAASFRRRVAWQRSAGMDARMLDPAELRDLAPRLTRTPLAAMWTPDGQLDPARLTAALAHDAVRHGAVIREGCPAMRIDARSVETLQGRVSCGSVVVACGAWSGALAPVPVRPVKGQRVLLRLPGHSVRQTLFDDRCYIVPKAGGHVLVGGTHEPEAGFDRRPTVAGMAWLVAVATGLLPELAAAEIVEPWAGLRPGTPDGLPVLGLLPETTGPWFATGHLARGVMLAPGTARLVADAIVEGRSLPPEFAAGRFATAAAATGGSDGGRAG